MLKFETQLAGCTMTRAQSEVTANMYHSATFATLQRRYPELQWLQYARGLFGQLGVPDPGLGPDTGVVSMADLYLDRLFPLLRHTPADVVEDYLRWRAALSLLPFTTGRLSLARRRFTLLGVKSGRVFLSLQSLCALRVKAALPGVVGAMYTRAFVGRRLRRRAGAILRAVLHSFRAMVGAARWLSPATTRHARAKLAAMRLELGLPAMYEANAARLDLEWGAVPVRAGTQLRNHLALSRRAQQLDLQLYSTTRRHVYWPDSSAVVNAYYMSIQNSILIPSGN